MRFLLPAIMMLFSAQAAYSEIIIGVLAPQGPEAAYEAWQPFADHMSDELGEPVSLIPVGASDGTEAFFEGYFDIFVGNPVQTAVIVDTMNARPIASVVRQNGAEFAGLIVARNNGPIENLQDLSGARIATLGDWAAGGFLFQAHHLVSAGLGRPGEIGTRVRGANQNELVQMVLDGAADAAFIRTGVLENHIALGLIEPGTLRVLDAQSQGAEELQRSTRWFPSWFVSVPNATNERRIAQLNDILNEITPDLPAAQRANILGFTSPLDIQPVIQAMQQVGVAPYN